MPTFPEISPGTPAPASKTATASQSPAPSSDASLGDLGEIVELSKTGIVSSFKTFMRENLFGALGTAAIVMYGFVRSYLRIFPNKIHVDAFVLGRLPDEKGGAEGKKVFHAQTMEVSSLSGFVGTNLAAWATFNIAMWRARNSLFWPTMAFSNSPVLRRLLHGGPHEIVARPLRSMLSSLFRDDVFLNSQHAAVKRHEALASGKKDDLFQPVSCSFVVCTYERVCDIQPRAYLIPQQDVVNYLVLLPEIYKAAQETGGESMRRLVRVLEICGSIVLRYPTALKNLGVGENLAKAQGVARDIFRMYALAPDESLDFLNKYIAGDRSHIEPTEQELQRMRKLWYASNDEAHHLRCEEAEQTMPSFFEYGKACVELKIPTWLYVLSLPASRPQQAAA